MKKIFMLGLTVLFCALFSFGTLASNSALKLSASEEKQEIVLSVAITEGSLLCTTEFYVRFDSSVLEFKKNSAAAGDAARELSPYVTASAAGDGVIKISYTCTEPLTSGGELLTLRFKAKKDAEVQFVSEIEHAETFDGEHIRSLDFSAEGCSIQVHAQTSYILLALAPVAVAAAVGTVIAVRKKNK